MQLIMFLYGDQKLIIFYYYHWLTSDMQIALIMFHHIRIYHIPPYLSWSWCANPCEIEVKLDWNILFPFRAITLPETTLQTMVLQSSSSKLKNVKKWGVFWTTFSLNFLEKAQMKKGITPRCLWSTKIRYSCYH